MPPKKDRAKSSDQPSSELYAGFNSRLAKAVGHPLRARALAILNERVASPKELHLELDEPLGNVSYHVGVLEELGCVELVKAEQRRGAMEHFFRGVTRSFLNAENWASLSDDAKNGVSVAGLQMINDASKAALENETFDSRDDRHLSCTPLNLDDQGWEDAMTLLSGALDQVLEIQGESASRLAKAKDPKTIRATISLLGFESPGG
ncbi:MAG TPA: helix-turn-helix domain-containing protein [Solirubrobacterales bacterium]|nr:helix-turn-helix domain-containing protein [Solirubrobacterales bacterium]